MISSAPASAIATESPDVARRFRYWQWRTIFGTMFGYAAFYFVRKNLSLAMPGIQSDLGITKADLGLYVLTLHGLLYGVSRFVNGMWADRVNGRYFMVVGLMLSVGANIVFGLSSTVLLLGVVWMINGWFQGMGFPACCRLLTHWIHPRELATKMSIWNTSHSIGGAVAVMVCGFIAEHFPWRWCFFAPAIACTFACVILFIALRDTPSSVGLPEIEVEGDTGTHGEDKSTAEYKAFVRTHVFGNPYIWWISLANFFVYILRFAVLDWGPTLLKEMKHFSLGKSGLIVGTFEVSGVIGMLIAGWLTDRVFGGRGARTCVFCMIGAMVSMFLFWKFGTTTPLATAFLAMSGFFIYGPQALIGITAANLATRRAAATAAGFTGLFGYASTIASGWGLGKLVDTSGWDVAFVALLVMGALGMLMFILAWPAKAHGYGEAKGGAT